jgi:hypothetical protein
MGRRTTAREKFGRQVVCVPLKDPVTFVQRLNRVLNQSI